ncbi:MAG: Lrp/AsnC ligand binding domain-containing protein [Promethearchaeota archaeon]
MSVSPGEDERIVRELVKDRIIEEAWLTTGEYDVLLVIRGEDTEEINHYVNERIRGTEGVIRTVVTFGIQSITHGD